MEKRIKIGSWEKMSHESAFIVPVSSRGLTNNDKRAFMEKRAASNIFADKIASIDLKPGDLPIHLIALGATEAYSANRNGDGFNIETCRKCHPTFVKHARYYRHHPDEKTEDNSYGQVKLSAFNEDMKRVELLLIGNATKEAADRNGGKIMPQATIDKLEKGAAVPWSMGCSLSADRCCACDNKAASAKEYCTEDTCVSKRTGEKMPGCASGLGKIAHTGELQYVENPNCVFKDISEVTIPADKTAYGWKADYLTKQASYDTAVIGGAELYNLLVEPSDSPIVNVITKLAELEDFEGCYTPEDEIIKFACQRHIQDPRLSDKVASLSDSLKWSALMKYAGKGVVFSASNFIKAYHNKYAAHFQDDLIGSMVKLQPGIYHYIKTKEDIPSKVASLSSGSDTPASLIFNDKVAEALAKESLRIDNVRHWVKCAALSHSLAPYLTRSTEDLFALPAAIDYALYKAAALLFLPDNIKNKEQYILWTE